MKKWVLLTVVAIAMLPVINGCSKKAAHEENAVVTENTAEQEVTSDGVDNNAMTENQQNQQNQTANNLQTTAPATLPAAADIASTIKKPSIEQIQQALKNAGIYQGTVDGKMGPRTKKAIQEFQRQNSLAVDGRVGPKTWQKMAPYLNKSADATPASSPTAAEPISN